tara:strand:+ start:484 stop:1908 length:1425 start_codon:yes stop_codon:yes gene_type:complete
METLQRTANRGSVSTGLYEVANSVKFDDGNNTTTVEFFERNVSSAGSRTTATFSAWLKRTQLDANQYIFTFGNVDNDNGRTFARFQEDDTIRIGGGTTTWLNTNRVFRDTSAWYHIVVAIDTTSGTANNRVRLYVNGEEVTEFGTRNNPSQNDVMGTNFGKQVIGYNSVDNGNGFNGYMCEVVIQDGVASAPTEFGEFDSASGIWIPKDASGATMGTNGSYLKFENASSMGAATAGNAFTVQNINQVDQATDTCTNNFCTWLSDGSLFNSGTDNETFFQGGTKTVSRAGTGWTAVYPTQSFAGGKWYMEYKAYEQDATAMYGAMPVSRINSRQYNDYYHGQDVDGSIGLYLNNGQIYYGTAGSGGAGSGIASGAIIGVAIDMENYKAYFAVNNTYVESGNPAGNSNGRSIEQEPYVFSMATYSPNVNIETNFGGYTTFSDTHTNTDENGFGSFVYAPPSGFLACCSKNLATTGG